MKSGRCSRGCRSFVVDSRRRRRLKSPRHPQQLLAALLDKSLLRWDGVARYDMHELVRQYASEKLEEIRELGATRQQHAVYFLALAEKAEPHLFRAEQLEWFDRLEVEHNNLRAALAWNEQEMTVEFGLRLASALHWFWCLRGHSRRRMGVAGATTSRE